MTTTISIRRDSAADWTSNNPVLALGELGYETDTTFHKLGEQVLVLAWSSELQWHQS